MSNNGLTDVQLRKILADRGLKVNSICFKDQLPKKLKFGFYIINLQSSTQGSGSHWTSLYYNPDMSLYFDAFGFVPSVEVENRIGRYMYNDADLQDIRTTSCGYYCVAFIKFLYHAKDKYRSYETFVNILKRNPKENNRILEQLINSP